MNREEIYKQIANLFKLKDMKSREQRLKFVHDCFPYRKKKPNKVSDLSDQEVELLYISLKRFGAVRKEIPIDPTATKEIDYRDIVNEFNTAFAAINITNKKERLDMAREYFQDYDVNNMLDLKDHEIWDFLQYVKQLSQPLFKREKND